jgi:hypothetical protein
MDPKEIFFFDKMLTPKIITAVYWIGLLAVTLTALSFLFTGQFMYAIAALFGLLFVRIYCELMIVAFKMNESLQAIRDK